MLENKTSRRILLTREGPTGGGYSHVIPAHGRKAFEEHELEGLDLEKWTAWGLIEVGEIGRDQAAGGDPLPLTGCFGLVILLALLIAAFGAIVPSLRENAAFWNTLGTSTAAVLLMLTLPLVARWWGRLAETMEGISPYLSVVLFLLIGLGLPAYIIYKFSEAYQLIGSGSINVALLGRTLQFAFIGIASTLPALLYFLFDRQQLEKVRRNFYREVMRLDPNIQTSAEAETKYAELVEEIYGSSQATSFLLTTGSPILLSTLLIILGWTWTLMPIGETAQIANELALDALFSPVPNALNFGFLGAYFFALNMVFRGYIRADLTPKTYTHITLRLLTTTIVIWVLSMIPAFAGVGDWRLLLVAFFVGIVPETGLALLQDSLRRSWVSKILFQRFFPSLEEEHPLTVLEGINLYDRARLLEEGIENVENLAHSQLIELMLRTRIPTPRLVDLFDQAVLYLHVHGIKNGRGKLRELGIRTATDLEKVYEGLEEDEERADAFLKVLDDANATAVRPLETVLEALKDDEWMAYLKNWRSCSEANSGVYTWEDFARAVGAEEKVAFSIEGRR